MRAGFRLREISCACCRDARFRSGTELFEILLAALGGGEAFGDLLLPRVDRTHERRPQELHRHPDENREGDRLRDEREVDVHA